MGEFLPPKPEPKPKPAKKAKPKPAPKVKPKPMPKIPGPKKVKGVRNPRIDQPVPVGLTAREERFAELHVEGKTDHEAYTGAGYSDQGASANSTHAWKIRRRPHVAEYITALKADRLSRSRLDRDQLIKGIENIALKSGSEGTQLNAYRTLMQHHGLLTDRIMHVVDNDLAYVILGEALASCQVDPDLASRIIREFNRLVITRGR